MTSDTNKQKGLELWSRAVDDGSPHRANRDERNQKDELELAYWGKKQKLRRNFGMVSIIAMTCTLMSTWEAMLIVFSDSFANGGPTGIFFSFLYAWLGTLSQALVMAEMASMIPLAGGQYNWVSILAPPRYSRFMSYMAGWFTVLVWQSIIAGEAYLTGAMIQATISLTHPEYNAKKWQLTLIIYAAIAFCIMVNTVLARLLPQLESIMLIVHITGFFAILIPLTYLGPHGTASEVFSTWVNEGNWPSKGLVFFMGSATNIYCFIGLDVASHMAEEIQNASYAIPRAIIASAFFNGLAGLAMLIAVLFCMGNIQAALNAPFAYMEIFQQAVSSTNGALGMITIILFTMISALLGCVAGASRMLWAFAREKAIPGHQYISRVPKQTSLPLYSITTTAIICLLLSLFNLWSSAAFNAFTSLTISGYFTVYCVAASCLLWRRLYHHKTLKYGPFKLGRAGIPIIITSIIWSIIVLFWSFWPQFYLSALTLQNMNFAVVMFVAVIVWALLYWYFCARHVYIGPIQEITLEEYRQTHEDS